MDKKAKCLFSIFLKQSSPLVPRDSAPCPRRVSGKALQTPFQHHVAGPPSLQTQDWASPLPRADGITAFDFGAGSTDPWVVKLLSMPSALLGEACGPGAPPDDRCKANLARGTWLPKGPPDDWCKVFQES